MRTTIEERLTQFLKSLEIKYENDNNIICHKIVHNAQYYDHDEWEYDDAGVEFRRYSLIIQIPKPIYADTVGSHASLSEKIREDLNIHFRALNEYINKLNIIVSNDLSQASGRRQSYDKVENSDSVLVEPSSDDESRIWGKNSLRIFISYLSKDASKTANLKEKLKQYYVSSFVAHDTIDPSREWQKEIEMALQTMHVMVPLLTDKFNESKWTDHEVGIAMGLGVPIFPVKFKYDPYGFIGKYHALKGEGKSSDQLALDLMGNFLKNDRLNDLAIKAYLDSLRHVKRYDQGNKLSKILPYIKNLSPKQVDDMLKIYNNNSGLKRSFGFNGKGSTKYGPGLIYYIENATNDKFKITDTNRISRILPAAEEESESFDSDIPF